MINVKLLQKIDFSEKTARIFLIKTIQILVKTLQIAKRNQFKAWIILILAVYAIARFGLYRQHKARRYELNEVTHYIPHGEKRGDSFKHILLWNPSTNDDDTSQDLESVNCNMKNCIFSRNRRLFHSMTDFDAIMFDVGNSKELDELPGIRNKEQIYIMANEVSPLSTKNNLKFDENFFNMTFSYKSDSDVQWTHAKFYDTEMRFFIDPLNLIKWRKPTIVQDQTFINSIRTKKSKLSAWFVSNCKASSNRDLLANKLQNYMNVDIYGSCGNYSCTSRNPEKCVDTLSSNYKFYFTFENSICVDYITENVFLSMRHNIIPIIFNGVTDMQHFLPPHSYINVNDFNSIKELAKYLKFLDENPQEFANYFWWTKYYKLVMHTKEQSYCDICMKLNQRNESIKYILFWNKCWYLPYWNMPGPILGEEYLKSVDCPVTNCIFSHDRDFLPLPTDYDALIFHMGLTDRTDIDDLPKYRRDDQLYIIANKEMEADFFNWTLTYRLDSDVFSNYGVFADLETGSIVAPSKKARWRDPEPVDDPELLEFISTSKTKMAAWFLSHCVAQSNRDILANKMKQYMQVDIYGKCGNLSCPIRDIYSHDERQVCTDMLNTTYKFYLSFENSICTDYMTEKVFLNMDNFIVPILYNGITDMQHFLPPHSYIHVNDSSSVEDLVNYLKYLDKNPQEYANYFWWKKYYKVIPDGDPYIHCNLCMKLNNWNSAQKRRVYSDMQDWHSPFYMSIYLLYDLNNYYENKIKNYKIQVPFKNIPKSSSRNDSIKYILFWNNWYRFPDWYMGGKLHGAEYLKSIDCPVTNCVFSHDRNFLPQPTDYDALVFHVGDPLEPDDLPEFRRDDQIYVMANEE
ncbi:unnamed protein product [Chironomus riparius]|uniref:Fucosyltransferase n=1 Tax=Chironomus riparius TaxID=315576 RepID=A0A9N9S6G1_9DIPT|nr:unnamed protein product [Chironomus riparius]